MATLRGRKQAITWQLPPEVIALVKAFAQYSGDSQQVAAEKLIVSGFKKEMESK